jgi:bacterioferritin
VAIILATVPRHLQNTLHSEPNQSVQTHRDGLPANFLAKGTGSFYPDTPPPTRSHGTRVPFLIEPVESGKTSIVKIVYARSADMDKESFLDLLNEDLQTEYQSIVQYIRHVATISGAEFLSVLDELKVHLVQELNHAQILAGQIAFLGGTPSTDVPQVDLATGRDALTADLRLEESQLERYRQRFSQAMDLSLADVAEALRPLLEQTQEHVRDLQTALSS